MSDGQIELKIRLKSEQIGIRNGMIAETHSLFNSQNIENKDEETATYGIGRIANNVNCTISPFSIDGWLRHGITEYLISEGISVCHSFDMNNVNKLFNNRAEADLQHGYHRKGTPKNKSECEESKGEECIVSELFGYFGGHPRKFSIMPLKITPVQGHYDKGIKNITGKGNYRRLAISPRAHCDSAPLTTHNVDIVANLDAILYLRMYENNSHYTALIMKGIEYINEHRFDYNFQLGGHRTFGCGFVEATFLPPDLTREETTKYHSSLMKKEDDAENSEKFPKTVSDKIHEWENTKKELSDSLKVKLEGQKKLFPLEPKWWNQKIIKS